MLPQFIFCKLLFIPFFVYASNSTLPQELDSKKVEIPKDLHNLNKTKITMISEGGAIMSNASTLTLPKEVHTIPLSLDTEVDKTKERTVVPRKGVKYTPPDDDSTSLHSEEFKNAKVQKKPSIEIPQKDSKELTASEKDKKNDIRKLVGGKLNTTNKDINNNVHKTLKPLVLSFEGLSEADQLIQKERVNKLHPETKDTSDTNANSIRSQTVNASHPDMIMPVIITILIVPLFAVLGYLALRRGQEAWKNRHYKRMDFLLDGMYND